MAKDLESNEIRGKNQPLLLDMVHHNPGEPPLCTKFAAPESLVECGYNGQVLKHFNAIIRYDKSFPGVFPSNQEETTWLREFTERREAEIQAVKRAGLLLLGHIDLIILPKAIVDKAGSDILDEKSGKISFQREATQALQREMFEEMFTRYPEIDGVVVRVGETYLFDTPYHTGNSACVYTHSQARQEEQMQFVRLLEFLRKEVCVRHGRLVIHRTWDTWKDRFHSNPSYYLDVTEEIEPHPNLYFSIKHSQADFHRWIPWNPCLGIGRHPQIVEVQCQREYEGKGAFPCYIARCVIEGFPEMQRKLGLRDLEKNPLLAGLWTWSRGGGWFGPYLRHEFWPELNVAVLVAYMKSPWKSEELLFLECAEECFGLDQADAARLREIALLSETAVLHGKCCEPWDSRKPSTDNPCNSWFRDDRLGGWDKLRPVFAKLVEWGELEAALEEKAESVREWLELRRLADSLGFSGRPELREEIIASAEYGLRLFQWIEAAWRVLALRWRILDSSEITEIFAKHDLTYRNFLALPEEYPLASTLFEASYWNWPGSPRTPGLGDAVEDLRKTIFQEDPCFEEESVVLLR